jgi:sugar-specific transcriptional regulator TrmB
VALGSEVEERVVASMKQLGFTATDAKTYIALLRGHPATGYELAARSSVPRSAIYGVLRRLQSLGLVNAIEDKPARYVPLPPERLHGLLESRFTRNLETFKTALDQVVGPTAEVATWTVVGYKALLEQVERLVGNAQERVCLSLWRREAEQLARAFGEAVDRGVDVVLFSFNPLPDLPGTVFSYGIDAARLEAWWDHKLILVADDGVVLVGDARPTEENRAVVSEEPALVEMAVANLVLDLTLFAQRTGVDTAEAITHLTRHLAPVDDLIAEAVAAREGG